MVKKTTQKFNTNNKLVGQEVTAKVVLHNYRFPKNHAPVSGEYAIVIFEVLEVISGVIDGSCRMPTGYIVVTGNMPRIESGMEYIFSGTLSIDKQWGPQYQCSNIHFAYNMDKVEDQKKFFSFFMSENQIEALFAAVDNPIRILEQKNIGELIKIKGVGPTTANRMCIKYAENINNSRAYVVLKDLGITKNAIDKLILQFGSADVVIDIIKNNPYSLISLVRGYGWEKADKIALSQGFGHGCKERCIAYATYKLEKTANEDGNSRILIGEFMDDVEKTCTPTSREQLAEWIKEFMVGETEFETLYLKSQRNEKDVEKPLFFYSKENKSVGLYSLRLLEKQISDQLRKLTVAKSNFKFDKTICENIITEVEKEQGYEYTHEQKKAIWNILNNNVSILTGSSGTGKSSTLKPLIRIFNYYHLSVAQCALSGRASSLLTEYTGLEGKTIHRLLNYIPDQERFAHTSSNPLSQDVVILDETSMVGEELFLCLISSIKNGAKLIMLGDTKQLPPMSVGNILNDCIQSGYVSTNTLTIIQRQAMKSGIVAQSIHICEGKSIVKNDFCGEEIRGELKDFKVVCNEDSAVVHRNVIEEFKKLYIDRHISADDIQIVVPVRSKGVNSCRFFNAEIQNIVNSKNTSKNITIEVSDGGQKFEVTYKPGDRIIVIKNNYHAKTLDGGETAIFNGNMGHIVDLDQESMIIELGEEERVIIPRESWGDINLAYACTCHKLQGSQAPYVIVGLDNGSYPLLMREWLYTAITRARKYCALIGQPKAINTATRISNIKVKKTWLKDDLYELYKKQYS